MGAREISDATIIHTCAASYISNQSGLGRSAAEQAADRKIKKYEGLPDSFVFQPIAIETMGCYNSSALGFIGEIGRRTSSITGDVRETAFLYQRLSVCIQRYNLVAFPVDTRERATLVTLVTHWTTLDRIIIIIIILIIIIITIIIIIIIIIII